MRSFFGTCIFAAVVAAAVSSAALASAHDAPASPYLDRANSNNDNRNSNNNSHNLRHLQDLLEEDEVGQCANRRAQECGAENPDRPMLCCTGYVCAGGGASVKCVPNEGAEGYVDGVAEEVGGVAEEEDEDDEEPTAVEEEEEVPPDDDPPADSNCAAKGERSQQCGATNTDRPAVCCSNLICSDGASVTCLEDTTASTVPTGNGLYQTERYSLGGIEIEGTSFESAIDGDTIRIDLPAGSTAKAFVMMFMGDSGSDGEERVAYHDNWAHLIDNGEGQSQDLNCRVQHKVWAGNNDSFRVWDGINKFVIMPSFVGVDEADPIVEAKSWRFTDVERVYAPSVNTVQGGVVLVMYLLDSNNDNIVIQGVLDDEGAYRVLSSDLTKSGESMAAFAAATDGTCTGPIAATSTGEFASGIAVTISLRPLGLPVEDLQDCSVDVDEIIDAPEEVTATDAPTASSTLEATMGGEPTDMPTSAPTQPPAWFEPTTEPTTDDMPTSQPTPMNTVIPPSSDPPSAATAFASRGAYVYGALAIASFLFNYVI